MWVVKKAYKLTNFCNDHITGITDIVTSVSFTYGYIIICIGINYSNLYRAKSKVGKTFTFGVIS